MLVVYTVVHNTDWLRKLREALVKAKIGAQQCLNFEAH